MCEDVKMWAMKISTKKLVFCSNHMTRVVWVQNKQSELMDRTNSYLENKWSVLYRKLPVSFVLICFSRNILRNNRCAHRVGVFLHVNLANTNRFGFYHREGIHTSSSSEIHFWWYFLPFPLHGVRGAANFSFEYVSLNNRFLLLRVAQTP